MAVCYRHKDRETGVSCSNCGNPICPDCMTPTPVGMRCPECSKQRTQVRTLQNVHGQPQATYILIGICVLLWLGEYVSGGRGSAVFVDLSLFSGATDNGEPVGVATGEYWRLITGGFLHDPRWPFHLLFNMWALWVLGQMLEPVLGTVRFLGLYFASLLAGSLGALLLSSGNTPTVGASGAVFGLMAAAFVMQRARGIDPMQSGIGPVILLNLVITFVVPFISIGGHLGGLIGGGITALVLDRLGLSRRNLVAPVLICAAISAACVAGAIVVAAGKSLV